MVRDSYSSAASCGSARHLHRGGPPCIGGAHAVEHGLTLLVDEVGEQLLREAEDQRPRKDLCGGVERVQAGNELTTHEQQAEERGRRARWEFQRGQCKRQTMAFR